MNEPDNDRDWWVLYTSMPGEKISRRIAEVLRGNPSKKFLDALANLFDPSVAKRNYKANVTRTEVGRTRSQTDEIGKELTLIIDEVGSVEAAVAAVREKHGISRTKCFEALRQERDRQELQAWVDAGFPMHPRVQKT